MMELYENGADLNFNFTETFADTRKGGKCVIVFSDGCETGSEVDATMSHKQRNQANARERFRTHRYWFSTEGGRFEWWRRLICQSSLFSVNSAFNTLRLLIPTEPKNRKLSKIETLRLAKSYISHLSATLVIGEGSEKKSFESQMKNDLSSLKEIRRVGNRALRQRVGTRTNISSTIVRTSARSAFLQSFIRDGLIRIKWFWLKWLH